jgi:hypothetical protein
MKIYASVLSVLLAGAAFAADTAATPVATAMTTPAKPAKSMTAVGSVVSADVVGNTLTVEGKKKVQWTFSVPAAAKITQSKKAITIGDIAAGSKVAVRYTKDGAALTASSIKVWPAKKAAPADSTKK